MGEDWVTCGCDARGTAHSICVWYPPPTPPAAPSLRVTVIIERHESLSGAVREAEHKAANAGALNIQSCEVAGNDGDGWYVTVVATS